MTPTLKARLDQIGVWLADEEEGYTLWIVLTALRGPDVEDGRALKWATTAIIRAAALGDDELQTSAVTNHTDRSVVYPLPSTSRLFSLSHFEGHTQEACQVLGIPCVRGPFRPGERQV